MSYLDRLHSKHDLGTNEGKTMFTGMRRGASRLAGVCALVGVAMVGVAGPASASPGRHNSSEGIRAIGLINAGPFAASNFPDGPSTNTTVSASVPTLLTTGVINTAAGASTASASVANLAVTLTPLAALTATAVSSQCSYVGTTLSGSSSIAGGTVKVGGVTVATLATNPAPNTTVVGLTGVATVVLNRQVTNADGSLTVDAIYITLLNGQTIVVASSTCQPQVLVIPVIAPVAAGVALPGALGLAVLGVFMYRRRHTNPDLARA